MIERHAEVAIVSALSVVAVAGAYVTGHTDGWLTALEPSRNLGEFVLAAEKPVQIPEVVVPEPSAPLPSLDEINAEARAKASRLPPLPRPAPRSKEPWQPRAETVGPEPQGEQAPVDPPPAPIVIVREVPVAGAPVAVAPRLTLRLAPMVSLDDGRPAFGGSLYHRLRGRASLGIEAMRAGGSWFVGGGLSIGIGR